MELRGSPRYRLEVQQPGLPAVVFLRGELDIGVCPRLREILRRAGGGEGGAGGLVVDMTDATFADSSVLGVLAEAHARLAGRLRVRGVTGVVARAFAAGGVDHLVTG